MKRILNFLFMESKKVTASPELSEQTWPLEKGKYTDLSYLRKQTKGNQELMKKMILLYLKQTPELLNTIKQGTAEKDWVTVNTAVHKMIPSFWMMGIDSVFEKMSKTLQEHTSKNEFTEEIPELVSKLEEGCMLACKELQVAVERLG